LTFNEKIEPAFSSITLDGPAGKPVPTAKADRAPDNPAVLQLQLPPLAAGAYTVKWAVAGRDGHRRTGSYKFTVK
jgi:methionine-rich copper-binding protein CopC